MSSWLNHLYFENLYDAIIPMQDALEFKAPLSEVSITGLPINLHDPAFVQLAKLIDYKVGGDESSLMALKSAFFTWRLDHSKGPGSYDPTELNALFDIGMRGAGFLELDRLFGHLAGVSISEVIRRTEVSMDPGDDGLHGDVCYRCHLHLVGVTLPNMYGERKSFVMASSLDRLIPLLISEMADQSDRFNRFWGADEKSAECQMVPILKRSKPTSITIQKNGEEYLAAEIPNKMPGEKLEIDWKNASYAKTVGNMKTLVAALPKALGGQIKGRFLEDELGM